MMAMLVGGPGPVVTVVAKIGQVFSRLARLGFATDLGPLMAGTVVFVLLAVILVMIMFYLEILKHNKVNEDKITSFKEAGLFLGGKLLLLPLLVAAPVLPMVAKGFADQFSVWGASQSTAMSVAQVGDNLFNKITTLNRTVINPEHLADVMEPDMFNAGVAGKLLSQKNELIATEKSCVGAIKQLAIELDEANAESPVNQAAIRRIETQKAAKEALLAKNSAAIGGIMDKMAQWRKTEHKKAAEDGRLGEAIKSYLLNKKGMAPSVTDDTGTERESSGYRNEFDRIMKEYGAAKSSGQITEIVTAVEGEFAQVREDAAEEEKMGAMDAVKFMGSALKEVVGSIGFYCSIAPALLGIGAGTLSTLKAGVGLLQFGAKVSIMVNVGLSIASIFAPLFIFLILFKRTESYAYTFLRFLLSVVIACFGIHFVMNTVGNAVLEATRGLLASVNAGVILTGEFGKNGSLDLFKQSAEIGLKAFGIGMIAEFITEVCKSAGQVAQGVLSGSFNP